MEATEVSLGELVAATKRAVTARQSVTRFDDLPRSAWCRLPMVCEVCGVKPATIWRWSKDPNMGFPAPRKFSARVTAWNAGQLRDFLNKAA
jgi:predicted DNA-binding transcriptional regulator AlpA